MPHSREEHVGPGYMAKRAPAHGESGGGSLLGYCLEHELPMVTTWIEGILKDLMHSSISVSMAKLINNVREIIYPCNSNLVIILEHKLHLLTSRTTNSVPNSMLQRSEKDWKGRHPLTHRVRTSRGPSISCKCHSSHPLPFPMCISQTQWLLQFLP